MDDADTIRPGKQDSDCRGRGPRISLVIVACNEQETIRQTIRAAAVQLLAATAAHEILVVDDGSTDRTADEVRAEAEQTPYVRLVRQPTTQGYGAALRTGCRETTHELIALAPAGSDLTPLARMVPLLDEADVVSWAGAIAETCVPRRLLSWGYHTLIALLTGSAVANTATALTVIRRQRLAAVLPESDDTFAGAEVFARARLEGLRVAELALHDAKASRRPAKMSLGEGTRALSSLLRFWWSRVMFPAPNAPAVAGHGWLWAGLAVLALVAGSLLLLNRSYPLLEPDEGRYAEVARQMVESGDWVVPTLNHRPFYDKPPLFYWLVGGGFQLLGSNEWSARLVPALAAFLTVLAVFLLGRGIVGARGAFLAGLALALTSEFVIVGRIVILDSLLTLFVTVALLAAYRAVQCGRVRWSWWLVSAVSCGLGVLTKGPIALVLLTPPVIAFSWLNRGAARPNWRQWAAYLAVVAALVAPWYIAIVVRDPHFAYHFLVDQHLVRFFMHEYHVEPWWYFVPVLLLGCLPWSLLLVQVTGFLFNRSAAARALRPQSMGFFLLWAGWCVLFFSMSSSKLPPYILPALPALALLVGSYLDRVLCHAAPAGLFEQARTLGPRLGAGIVALVGMAACLVSWHLGLVGAVQTFVLSGLCVAVTIALAIWGKRLSTEAVWLVFCVLGAAVVLESAQDIVPAWARKRSAVYGTERWAELVRDGRTPVVCYGGEWGSIPFYVGRADIVFNCSELPAEDIKKFVSEHARYVLVVRHKQDLERFRLFLSAGGTMTPIRDAGEIQVALVEDGRRAAE